jgi:hypothetical protein
LIFGASPSSTVFSTSAGNDHGSRAVVDQASQIRNAGQPVKSQLNQLCAAFCKSTMLKDNHLVPGAANADANHDGNCFPN